MIMAGYEYKVVPAPSKGQRGKGVKGAEGRFAHALELAMNEMAADGWEFQRSETLPSDERSGLTSSTTNWRNVLVFRRARVSDLSGFSPKLLDAPQPHNAPQNRPASAATNPLAVTSFESDADEAPEVDSLGQVLKSRAASMLPSRKPDPVETEPDEFEDEQDQAVASPKSPKKPDENLAAE
jgi:hypothetical protein